MLDLAGPVPYQLTGPALRAARRGPRRPPIRWPSPAVREAVRAAVAAEPAVLARPPRPRQRRRDPRARPRPRRRPAGGDDRAQRVAERLAADETLRARLVRGLDLALLPAGSSPGASRCTSVHRTADGEARERLTGPPAHGQPRPRRSDRAAPGSAGLSRDRAGVLLAGALARLVRQTRGLAERQLERLQAVPQRSRVEGADLGARPRRAGPPAPWTSLRASSRSLWCSPSSARPSLTAAALIRLTATVTITSTAGTLAMSRVSVSKSGFWRRCHSCATR